MATAEPFVPHLDEPDRIGAADPGHGAPEPARGLGVEGEEPDRVDPEPGPAPDADTPFRTPVPPEHR